MPLWVVFRSCFHAVHILGEMLRGMRPSPPDRWLRWSNSMTPSSLGCWMDVTLHTVNVMQAFALRGIFFSVYCFVLLSVLGFAGRLSDA